LTKIRVGKNFNSQRTFFIKEEKCDYIREGVPTYHKFYTVYESKKNTFVTFGYELVENWMKKKC
jgi:hypothetical protein